MFFCILKSNCTISVLQVRCMCYLKAHSQISLSKNKRTYSLQYECIIVFLSFCFWDIIYESREKIKKQFQIFFGHLSHSLHPHTTIQLSLLFLLHLHDVRIKSNNLLSLFLCKVLTSYKRLLIQLKLLNVITEHEIFRFTSSLCYHQGIWLQIIKSQINFSRVI